MFAFSFGKGSQAERQLMLFINLARHSQHQETSGARRGCEVIRAWVHPLGLAVIFVGCDFAYRNDLRFCPLHPK